MDGAVEEAGGMRRVTAGRVSIYWGRGCWLLESGPMRYLKGGGPVSPKPRQSPKLLARSLQGIGGAAIPALATVSVAKVLPAGERGAGIGLIGSRLGAAVG